MPRDRGGPEARETGESLRELCEELKVIKGDMKPPSPDAWNQLATWVHVLRNDAMDIDADRRRLLQILNEADAITDRLMDKLRVELSLPPKNPLVDYRPRFEAAVTAFEQLGAGIRAVWRSRFFDAREPLGVRPNREGAKWPGYARIMRTAFLEAMTETNPGLEIKGGDDNAVHRFLAAVIPRITGEHPPRTTIARHLQGPRKRKH